MEAISAADVRHLTCFQCGDATALGCDLCSAPICVEHSRPFAFDGVKGVTASRICWPCDAADQVKSTSNSDNAESPRATPATPCTQSYTQRKYRQPIIQAAQAQATSYTRSASTGNASTGNQLYRQRKHRQPIIQAAQARATRYTRSASKGNASTGNQL